MLFDLTLRLDLESYHHFASLSNPFDVIFTFCFLTFNAIFYRKCGRGWHFILENVNFDKLIVISVKKCIRQGMRPAFSKKLYKLDHPSEGAVAENLLFRASWTNRPKAPIGAARHLRRPREGQSPRPPPLNTPLIRTVAGYSLAHSSTAWTAAEYSDH